MHLGQGSIQDEHGRDDGEVAPEDAFPCDAASDALVLEETETVLHRSFSPIVNGAKWVDPSIIWLDVIGSPGMTSSGGVPC
jgi:hypothetical protein